MVFSNVLRTASPLCRGLGSDDSKGIGFKRWVATTVTSADATRQKIGIKRWVETKVTSADAASSSPSAVPPPRFKVEITWSDDKVGDGDRWFV